MTRDVVEVLAKLDGLDVRQGGCPHYVGKLQPSGFDYGFHNEPSNTYIMMYDDSITNPCKRHLRYYLESDYAIYMVIE